MAKKTKKCICKVCLYTDVIRGLVDRQRNEKDKALVEDLYTRMFHAEDDAEYWRIRCHGGFSGLSKESDAAIRAFYARPRRRPEDKLS